MKEKIEYISWLRIIATFAVVLLHVSANYWYGNIGSIEWVISTCYLSAVRCAVPIFVMISGALFLRKEYTLSIKRLYKHNIGRLLVFLVFWHVVYKLYQIISVDEAVNAQSIVGIVKSLFNGETQVHLWFIYMIIGIYIICPVFKVFIEYAKKEWIEYFIVVFFIVGTLPGLLTTFNFSLTNMLAVNLNKLSVSMVSGYVGYFVLGYYLQNYSLKKSKRILIYILSIVALGFTIIRTYQESVLIGSAVETYFVYTMPNVLIMSVAVFLLLKNLNLRETKIIKLISDCSFGIYGIHMLILFLSWNYIISIPCFTNTIFIPLIAGVIFVLSLLVVILLRKIPVLGRYIV